MNENEEDNEFLIVDKQYINKLIEAKVPYFLLNDEIKICGFVKKNNNIIFNKEECQKIRKLARKYQCSTKIIYRLLKDLVIWRQNQF